MFQHRFFHQWTSSRTMTKRNSISWRLKRYKRSFIPKFSNVMSDPVSEKVQKMFESRAKAEADLRKSRIDLTDAIHNEDRRERSFF